MRIPTFIRPIWIPAFAGMTKRHNQTGFTLLEMLVALGILLLVIIAGVNFFVQSYKSYSYSLRQHDTNQEALRGIEVMVKQLREARDSEYGEYTLKDAGAQQIIFFSDIDSDSAVERVRYFLDGTNLKKGTIEPSGGSYPSGNEVLSTISQYVRNGSSDIFFYYDGNNTLLDVPEQMNQVKLIKIQLQINIDANRPQETYNAESVVQLRNLKENL